MVGKKFPWKNRVFPRKIADFTQKIAFFRDFCGTKRAAVAISAAISISAFSLLAPFFF